jgi:hypothetical protein
LKNGGNGLPPFKSNYDHGGRESFRAERHPPQLPLPAEITTLCVRISTMNLKPVLLIACLVASTAGAAVITPESEHTIWVKLDTTPSIAEIYAPPSGNDPPTIRIGTTPCVIAIDCSWRVKWFKKRWELISVRSPGNICRPVFQPDRSYKLSLNFVATKPGYKPGRADLHVVTLNDPGRDWAGKDQWPAERSLNVRLVPADKNSLSDDAKSSTTRTVLFAGGNAKGETGTLNVSANVEDARVYVDDQFAGSAPIQVVLPEGQHAVRIQKAGFQPVLKEIQVTSDATVNLNAMLSP